jgi:hypothetical protein
MRLAALQAEYLGSHPVGCVAVSIGAVGMMRNALEYTGVRET